MADLTGIDMSPYEVARKKVQIKNEDGSVSTERTITIEADGKYINIPTIKNGVQMTPKEAIREAMSNTTHYPTFDTIEEAETAAQTRSDQIGIELKNLRK